MTTTKEKDTKSKSADSPADEDQSAYTDVSAEVEQAEKDAQAPVEFDDEGKPVPQESTAAAKVVDEQVRRAAGQANGGGPWPQELLLKHYVGSSRIDRGGEVYTSHEDQ